MSSHLSDSSVQRNVEPACLQLVCETLGVSLSPDNVQLDDGTRFQVDGIDRHHRIVCEIFAHVGKMRDGQRKKLARDILKLLAVENAMGGKWRKIICVTDEPARHFLTGRSWCASVIRQFQCEVVMASIGDDIWLQIEGAQKLQAEGMRQ